MLRIYITILICLINIFVIAQNGANVLSIEVTPGTYRIQPKTEHNLIGDPYKNYPYSNFVIKNAKVKEIDKLRYNYYTDQMEYSYKNELYNLDKIQNIEITLLLQNKTFLTLYDKDKNEILYFQVIKSINNLLLLKRTPLIIKESLKKEDIMDVGQLVYEYSDINEIYYIKKGDELITIPKKRNDLIKIFNKEEIKNFINKEKISTNNELDLLKLLSYISTNNFF